MDLSRVETCQPANIDLGDLPVVAICEVQDVDLVEKEVDFPEAPRLAVQLVLNVQRPATLQ